LLEPRLQSWLRDFYLALQGADSPRINLPLLQLSYILTNNGLTGKGSEIEESLLT
jgi:hypothetical protein